jgi:hypothetical protein
MGSSQSNSDVNINKKNNDLKMLVKSLVDKSKNQRDTDTKTINMATTSHTVDMDSVIELQQNGGSGFDFLPRHITQENKKQRYNNLTPDLSFLEKQDIQKGQGLDQSFGQGFNQSFGQIDNFSQFNKYNQNNQFIQNNEIKQIKQNDANNSEVDFLQHLINSHTNKSGGGGSNKGCGCGNQNCECGNKSGGGKGCGCGGNGTSQLNNNCPLCNSKQMNGGKNKNKHSRMDNNSLLSKTSENSINFNLMTGGNNFSATSDFSTTSKTSVNPSNVGTNYNILKGGKFNSILQQDQEQKGVRTINGGNNDSSGSSGSSKSSASSGSSGSSDFSSSTSSYTDNSDDSSDIHMKDKKHKKDKKTKEITKPSSNLSSQNSTDKMTESTNTNSQTQSNTNSQTQSTESQNEAGTSDRFEDFLNNKKSSKKSKKIRNVSSDSLQSGGTSSEIVIDTKYIYSSSNNFNVQENSSDYFGHFRNRSMIR